MMNPHDRIIWAQTGRGTRIGTAQDRLAWLREGHGSLLEWYRQQATALMFDFVLEARGEVAAEVNHGRWLARCVFCNGAEEVTPREPVFYCLSCGNSENGGHVISVRFPAEQVRIEELLLIRPMENRNWTPDESLEQLNEENLIHVDELVR